MAGGAFSGGTSVDDLPEPGGPFAGSRAGLLQTFSEEVLVRLIWPDDEGIVLVNDFPTRRRNGGALEDGDVYLRTDIDTLYFYNITTGVWDQLTAEAVVEFYQVSATAPTLRPDGSALIAGDLWYNTVDNTFNLYDGTAYQLSTPDGNALINTCLLYTSPSPRDS